MNLFRLDGKVAVVTGAKGLLGPVWIRALLDAGARVIGLDLPKARPSKAYDELFNKAGSDQYMFMPGDVLNRLSLERALERCRKTFDVPTILINNAGVDQPPSATKGYHFEDIPFEVGLHILKVNVLGAFQMIQVFGKEMVKEKTGSIINIGSLYGSVSPDPHFYDHIKTDPPFLKPPLYGPSKAALINLTKYVAVMWGKHGIRVNALSPGGVFNNQHPLFIKKFTARVPLGRMAYPNDLTGPLVFLASDASQYITGENIKVDGGFTAL